MVYNLLSLMGAAMAGVSALVIVFLLIINFITEIPNPYLGVLIYMVLPTFLILGLLLIPAGIYLRWRFRQRYGEIAYRKWPYWDLNIPRHRLAFLIFILGTVTFLLLSSVGVYKAYQFTESVEFCGLACHKVMVPEYTTYRNSPHARVKCVDCHIGPGAGWYARSKLSGLQEVIHYITDNYPRPLPTPIKDLRPLRAECEQCHWPEQFYGFRRRTFRHFLYDRANTPWPIDMMMRIGGGRADVTRPFGIHYHMNIAVKVEYVARDRHCQDIPWVRLTVKKTGKTTVYEDASKPLTKDELSGAEIQVMDCVDCHNRPSHIFHSPDREMDLALSQGRMSQAIPEVKKVSVLSLGGKYPSDAGAMYGIESYIKGFYRKRYPLFLAASTASVNDAVGAAQRAYLDYFFPRMNASWADYPDSIGHFIFPGCMRCHDGNHKSADGAAISNNCRSCHIILSQGGRKPAVFSLDTGLTFRHPVDIGGAWKGGGCYNCHTGAGPPG